MCDVKFQSEMDLNTLTGPYKATKLWNHAMTLFCNGMPVHRHRRGMKYYNNCFTGAQAISWFHKALIDCPCFDQEVTKKQTQQLLQKFLTAGVFHNVKAHSRFKKNSLYEFVKENVPPINHVNKMLLIEKLENEHESLKTTTLQRNLKLQERHKNEKKTNTSDGRVQKKQNTDFALKYQLCQSRTLSASVLLPEDIWKKCVIERIQDLLIGEDISSKLPEFINPKWVLMNGSPEYTVVRKRMFLPSWVATAMWNVLSSERNQSQNSYPSFTEDVVNTVFDYFNYLPFPLIPLEFYDIIIHIFLQLMKIDENTKKKMYLQNPLNRKSMENLLLDMSSPVRQINISKINCTLLPANSCFETAFTSDMPVTRIVPQTSVDTVYLAGKTTNQINCYSEMLGAHVRQTAQSQPLRRSRSTAQSIHNACKKSIPVLRSKSDRKMYPMQCIRASDKPLLPSLSKGNMDKSLWKRDGCFDNYGLSKSLDNLNPDNINELDLKQAIDSLQILVDAAKSHSTKRYSDSSSSSALNDEDTSDSDSDISYEPVVFRRRVPLNHLLKYSRNEGFQGVWLLPSTFSLADSVYHLLFTLVPPECRSTVSLVLKFLHHLYKHSDHSNQVFLHFSDKILRPSQVLNVSWNPNFSKRVFHYLMTHNEKIFGDLPKDFVSYIDSQVEKLYENVNVPESNSKKPYLVKTGKETTKGKGLRSIAVKIKNLRL